ncbi:ABC transporter permease [Actinocatenispora comari]|uniref:Sulfate ABC transporter permease n=1 Tax=Actinocatenispora comari TaxID=2807577 RepID=A0A8J4EMT9_9ACTN|nr:ABC transporter permease [Actinocatenispora comari]GIL30742.1 sulfate ABC transporter permease [Actinocatenispora comari]
MATDTNHDGVRPSPVGPAASAGRAATPGGTAGGSGQELSGLDALELAGAGRDRWWARVGRGAWPKLLALALVLVGWQLVVWSGWKPDYLLPGPVAVARGLADIVPTADFASAVATTMRRAVTGFAFAAVVGFVLGILVARIRVLRAAIGSMITALQTMPSIAWFPLAILLYQLTEGAIEFVIVLGAAPAIANGVIAGVDYVPPVLVRVGRNLGARGVGLYRHVIAPAALPSVLAGMKQGWAFAWHSLMAGELLVTIANRPALGQLLGVYRDQSDSLHLIGIMLVVLAIGLMVDAGFGAVNGAIRRRRGMT